MIDFLAIASIVAAFSIATASPGPATLALATVSMSAGRRSGLLFATGLSFGLAFWGTVAATGLGAILQTSVQALFLLKLVGGVYLLWLAFHAARSSFRKTGPLVERVDDDHSFRRGLLLNLSNPKAVFAWMAVLALGLGDNNANWAVIVPTVICMAMGFVVYAVFAFVFSTPGAMAIYGRVRRWIEGVVAGLFALAGLGLIRSAFARI